MFKVRLMHDIQTDRVLLRRGRVVMLNAPDAVLLIRAGDAKFVGVI